MLGANFSGDGYIPLKEFMCNDHQMHNINLCGFVPDFAFSVRFLLKASGSLVSTSKEYCWFTVCPCVIIYHFEFKVNKVFVMKKKMNRNVWFGV